jgi:hypothetical protein
VCKPGYYGPQGEEEEEVEEKEEFNHRSEEVRMEFIISVPGKSCQHAVPTSRVQVMSAEVKDPLRRRCSLRCCGSREEEMLPGGDAPCAAAAHLRRLLWPCPQGKSLSADSVPVLPLLAAGGPCAA